MLPWRKITLSTCHIWKLQNLSFFLAGHNIMGYMDTFLHIYVHKKKSQLHVSIKLEN